MESVFGSYCLLILLITLSQGGTKEYKVLMDEFHHVSNAFLELGSGYFLAQKLFLTDIVN